MGVPTLQTIEEAHERIKPFIHRTPVLTSKSIDQIVGAKLFFKCENFQKIGAFKIRGATNAVLSLSDEEKQNGVCTHSSGNHAQAIAMAARSNGLEAHIVMPENSSAVKVEAVKGYGANIIFCSSDIKSRQSQLDELMKRTGAAFIHPFNNYNIIAGQATAAKELIEDTEGLDAIIAPIGGGGLMSGTALTTHYISPLTKIYGAEPEEVNDAQRSLQMGSIQENESTNTIADGLKTTLGDKTFVIIKEHVQEIFMVSEDEIMSAIKLVWERMKIIIEPSSAVPVAALIKNKELFSGQKVGVILSGGNVDLKSIESAH